MIELIDRILSVYRPFSKKITHDNIFAIAGQSAFFLLLSAVPLTMFGVSILQNLHIPEESLEKVFRMVFNEKATVSFSKFVSNVYNDSTGISIITLIVTLWSAAKGVHVITNGLNRVHHTYENRNWFFLRIRAMMYTVLIFVIVFASMAVIMLSSSINDWISKNVINLPGAVTVLFNLRYVIIFIYLVVMFSLLYRNFPNLTREKRRDYRLLNLRRTYPSCCNNGMAVFLHGLSYDWRRTELFLSQADQGLFINHKTQKIKKIKLIK